MTPGFPPASVVAVGDFIIIIVVVVILGEMPGKLRPDLTGNIFLSACLHLILSCFFLAADPRQGYKCRALISNYIAPNRLVSETASRANRPTLYFCFYLTFSRFV